MDGANNLDAAKETIASKAKPDMLESAEKWFERMKSGISTIFSADFWKEFFSKLEYKFEYLFHSSPA